MLDLTNKQYNLLNFVHPSLMRLARYDREHGTELMDTLFIYLQNACNTQRAAKMLNLHKNTLLYRHGAHPRDPGVRPLVGEDQFMLQLSYRVLFYLDLFKSRHQRLEERLQDRGGLGAWPPRRARHIQVVRLTGKKTAPPDRGKELAVGRYS
jgi:hypothetical protein